MTKILNMHEILTDDLRDEVYQKAPLDYETVLEDRRELMIDALCVWFDEQIQFINDDLRADIVNNLEKRLNDMDINTLDQTYKDHIGY